MSDIKGDDMKKRETGVLTIEASIVLMLFTFFVLFLFSFARVYRAQSIVSHAALQTADAVALESHLRENALDADTQEMMFLVSEITDSSSISEDGLLSLRYADLPKVAKEKFIAALGRSESEADSKLKNAGVKDGLSGIDFSDCEIVLGGDDVIISLSYTIELQFPVFGFEELQVTKAAKAKTFGGIYFSITTGTDTPDWGTTGGDTKASLGTEVTIYAEPYYGYKFVKWSDGNTDNPRTVTVTGSAHYTAVFEADSFGLNLFINDRDSTADDYGTVSGYGTYQYLDQVTVSVIPNNHYHFEGWDDDGDGDVDSTEQTRTITVDKTYSLRAIVKPNVYTVTVKSANSSQGTVGICENGSSPIDGVTKLSVEYGKEVKIWALKASNYKFVNWNNDNNLINATHIFKPDSDVTYTAYFAPDTFTVSFYNGNALYDTRTAKAGHSLAASGVAIPSAPSVNNGKYFVGWYYYVSGNKQTFTNTTTVSGNISVYAEWATPTIVLSGGGTGGNDTRVSVATTPANLPVTWSSSNTGVATVESGTIKAKGTGTVTITASITVNGKTYSDSVVIDVVETMYKVRYCMYSNSKGRHYSVNHQPNNSSNHNCFERQSYAKKTVSYTELCNAPTVDAHSKSSSDLKYYGINESDQVAYVFDNGSGMALYFIYETVGPGGCYISTLRHY